MIEIPWKYIPTKPKWKGWKIERQQKSLKDFLEKEDECQKKVDNKQN